MKYDKEYAIIEEKLNVEFFPNKITIVKSYNVKTGMNIIRMNIDEFYCSFFGMDEKLVDNLLENGIEDDFVGYMFQELSNFIKDELSNRKLSYIPTCFL